MWASEMFDVKEMRTWENKPAAEKTWANAKTYFVALYKSKKKHEEEREHKQADSKVPTASPNAPAQAPTQPASTAANAHHPISSQTA